jgi:hypothetical protein
MPLHLPRNGSAYAGGNSVTARHHGDGEDDEGEEDEDHEQGYDRAALVLRLPVRS